MHRVQLAGGDPRPAAVLVSLGFEGEQIHVMLQKGSAAASSKVLEKGMEQWKRLSVFGTGMNNYVLLRNGSTVQKYDCIKSEKYGTI